MEIESHSHFADYLSLGFGWFAGLTYIAVGNSYISPLGGICVGIACFAGYRTISHAHIKETTPGELKDLEEVVSEPFVGDGCKSKSVFRQKIRRISNLKVTNLGGTVHNLRETHEIFKKQLVDLVGEDGKSVPCVLPKNAGLNEGDEIIVDAVLKKIKVEENYQTGLKAEYVYYSF